MKTPLIIAVAAAVAVTGTVAGARDNHGGMDPEAIFQEFDADGDGQVTRAEVEAHGDQQFADVDTDGDGNVSEAEFVASAQAKAAERAAEMFARLDVDEDGMLSRDALTSRRGGERRALRMFERLDADGDDAVTEEELQAGLERFQERRGGHGKRGRHNQ